MPWAKLLWGLCYFNQKEVVLFLWFMLGDLCVALLIKVRGACTEEIWVGVFLFCFVLFYNDVTGSQCHWQADFGNVEVLNIRKL